MQQEYPKIQEGYPKILEGYPKIHEGHPKIQEGYPKIQEVAQDLNNTAVTLFYITKYCCDQRIFFHPLISSSMSTFSFTVYDTRTYYDFAYPTYNILCHSSPIVIRCKACQGMLLTLVSTMGLVQYLLMFINCE